jgi:hypothetical protein
MTVTEELSQETTTTTVTFEVTGEFITRHSRDLVQEGKVREAERFLLESVSGMEHSHMTSILRGHKKMVGSSRNDTLDLEDDDPTMMTGVINELYAGVVHDAKHYWKPYAQVTGWGARDVGAGQKFNHPKYGYGRVVPTSRMNSGKDIREFSESRNVAYMNNKQQDLQHILLIDGSYSVTLWERVDPPPFWVEITQGANWQEGLDDFLASSKKLSVRSHTSTFGDDYKFFPSEDKMQSDPITEIRDKISELDDDKSIGSNDFMSDFLEECGISSHAAKGMMQFLSGNEDDSVPVAISNAAMSEAYHGYILKDGRFFACEYHNHASLATRLFKHLFNKEVDDVEKEADKAGWIRIQKSALDGKHSATVSGKVTNKQQSTFSFWAAMHGFPEEDLMVYRC